jgi:hypothetical protein
MTSIYLLRDPRTGEVRYVGQSVAGEDRLNGHAKATEVGSKDSVHCWMRKLFSMGLKPEWELQEDVLREDADEYEVWYIAAYREAGCGLLNLLPGGKCIVHTPETKAKISAFRTGMKFSTETCARLSAVGKGKIHSKETKCRMSAAAKGRPKSELTKSRMSAARKGIKYSEETLSRMSEAHKGYVHTPEAREHMVEAQRQRRALELKSRFEAVVPPVTNVEKGR